jgi:hypothetical protein
MLLARPSRVPAWRPARPRPRTGTVSRGTWCYLEAARLGVQDRGRATRSGAELSHPAQFGIWSIVAYVKVMRYYGEFSPTLVV